MAAAAEATTNERRTRPKRDPLAFGGLERRAKGMSSPRLERGKQRTCFS
jgi:hypothetical protein